MQESLTQHINKTAGESLFKKVVSHAKEYGFVFPSSEIYEGLSAVYDYGQLGVELKKNIKDIWWKAMVYNNENIAGIDSAIFMHPKIWKASGHIDNFNDPLIDNKDSKKRYRADELIENKASQYIKKGKTNNAEKLLKALSDCMINNDLAGIKKLIDEHEIACPESGSKNWTDVRQFNLMFATKAGSVTDEADDIYLRPETAQGIFVNFLNVQKTGRMKIPFGIAQIGKAFRNEIVARQFIFRTREFEQMEMQFFVKPGEEMKWYEHWKTERLKWHKLMGLPQEKLKFFVHTKLAHYANAAVDIQYEFPFGFKEVEGIHSRTDFDLKQHEIFSGKKLQYFDQDANQSYVPYVVETSIGVDRMFLAVLCNAYKEEEVQSGDRKEIRTVLNFSPLTAPLKAAVFPLVKKDGLPELARKIFDDLKFSFNSLFEEKDTIGKRYRRQDAVGTPFCITVDHQTLQDKTVTLRERDSMLQERINIENVKSVLSKKLQGSSRQ